jgi:hypothetical protein
MYHVDALAGTSKTYQALDCAHWMARGGQKILIVSPNNLIGIPHMWIW